MGAEPARSGALGGEPRRAPPAGGPRGKWGDLGVRAASAVVLVPLALGALWFGGAVFAAVVALGAAGSAFEWLGLCRARGEWRAVAAFGALPGAVLLTLWGAPLGGLLLLAAATVASAAATGGIGAGGIGAGGVTPGGTKTGVTKTGKVTTGGIGRPWVVASGIPYLGLASVALVWLRQAPAGGLTAGGLTAGGLVNVGVLLLVVWASDIGAYLTGRLVGGALLAPSISPGKTWSGAVGGLAAAALVGLAASAALGGSAMARSAGMAVLIGLVAQLGDLFESRLKRHFGVKDSGRLIPGHGGLLDRLDALLAAAPVGALLALFLGGGVNLWE